jgi:hypothetical protein
MAQVLLIISFLKAIGPIVMQLIEAVDAAMPAGTPGKTKLDAFQALLKEAIASEQALLPVFDAAWPLVSQLVAAAIAAKKALPATPAQ